MGTYNNLEDINEMIKRLQGFDKGQLTTIKLVAEQSFLTGKQFNNFQDEILKLRIRIIDLERIVDSHTP